MNIIKITTPLIVFAILTMFGCYNGLPGDPAAHVTGIWGNEHIRLEAAADSTKIEYDCAHGTIDEQIVPSGEENFIVYGTHIFEHGGPIREGESPDQHPAKYEGHIENDQMTLTVIITDRNETIGTFVLAYGDSGHVYKCL